MSISKTIPIVAIAAAVAVALIVTLAFALRSGAPEVRVHEHEGEVALGRTIEATVTGSNFCLGCSLKKDLGAGAQCSIYGHKHSLKVTKAVAAGKELPEMNGWVLHYLETDKSQDLINKHHGENLTVTGRIYPNERVLEVASIEPEQPKKPEHPEHPK